MQLNLKTLLHHLQKRTKEVIHGSFLFCFLCSWSMNSFPHSDSTHAYAGVTPGVAGVEDADAQTLEGSFDVVGHFAVFALTRSLKMTA